MTSLNNPGTQPNIKRSLEDIDNKYYAVRFKVPTVGTFSKGATRVFQVPGNHIYVARIDHQEATYIKLGLDTNPWIRILQGDIITRDFTKFSIRIADNITKWSPITGRQFSGLLYVSNGPLIVRRHKKGGIFPNSFALGKIPVTNSLNSLKQLMFSGGQQPFFSFSTGAYGGTLIITNTGTVNVWLDFTGTQSLPGVGPNIRWFPILPGATFTMDLGCVLAASSNDNIPVIATDAGTGEIAVVVDAENDFDFRPNGEPELNENDSFMIEG